MPALNSVLLLFVSISVYKFYFQHTHINYCGQYDYAIKSKYQIQMQTNCLAPCTFQSAYLSLNFVADCTLTSFSFLYQFKWALQLIPIRGISAWQTYVFKCDARASDAEKSDSPSKCLSLCWALLICLRVFSLEYLKRCDGKKHAFGNCVRIENKPKTRQATYTYGSQQKR